MNNHNTESWSLYNKQWDYSLYDIHWIGGHFKVPNLSNGYHGILRQWWDFYTQNKLSDVLLVSEGNNVKNVFKNYYPNWNIKTTDKYFELQSQPDIVADICEYNSIPKDSYDIIISQATFEHLYNPWTAIQNCINSLKKDGFLYIHTHPPNFEYHSYPRDYFRFMKDWWYDIPHLFSNIQMVEFHMHENSHVFVVYRKK